MAFLQILILATILGLLIGAVTLLLAGSQRAERYPGLAIIPGALVGLDLGFNSQWGGVQSPSDWRIDRLFSDALPLA